MFVEVGLIAFSESCFEFAYEDPEEAQDGSLANLPEIFTSSLRGISRFLGGLRGGASSPSLSVFGSSQPPHLNLRTNPVIYAGA